MVVCPQGGVGRSPGSPDQCADLGRRCMDAGEGARPLPRHQFVAMPVFAATVEGVRAGGGPGSNTEPITSARVAALDGLRALAVVAVLLYHAGVARVRGGVLGVDGFLLL